MPQGYKIKRLYKKVDIVEHPLSEDTPKLGADIKINFNNLSQTHGSYWAVTLDGKVTKTMYKDNLLIPTKAMAVALAEEWESQNENINLKSLHLNNFLAKCIRAANDDNLQQYMREELYTILENDQICFRESEEADNQYKVGLALAQKEKTTRIFDILEKEFGVKLKIFHDIQVEPQHSSVSKVVPLLRTIDNYVLFSLYTVAQQSKSTAIALSFLLHNELSIREAVEIARVDENYQTQHFGKVEGAHDYDEANTLCTFATAKNIINLCMLR